MNKIKIARDRTLGLLGPYKLYPIGPETRPRKISYKADPKFSILEGKEIKINKKKAYPYVRKGYLKRKKKGLYKVTEKGRKTRHKKRWWW